MVKRKQTTNIHDPEVLAEQRRALPAFFAKDKLLTTVKANSVTLIVGETGSGKTTQIPQFLYEAGFAQGHQAIACTQPRRVAAMSVAGRVSEEMGVQLGGLVGYSVRFEDCTSSETKIKYMTDGMLLREALLDRSLSKYKVVIVDEAHERTVATDVLLGLLKAIQTKRKHDFRLIIMSATLATESFQQYFQGCAGTYIQGRQHAVDIFYTKQPQESYLDAALTTVLQIHSDEYDSQGDILVFLTGQEEIESCERLLQERSKLLTPAAGNKQQGAIEGLTVLPMYAALPPDMQMRVFEPAESGKRKVILATNIAETSITIPGIRYVIDTGVVKTRAYSPKLGSDCLQVTPISQAQARQRSGRAGRESEGKAYRLYTEETYQEMMSTPEPEIKRCNLASVILQLKALGIDNPLTFDFLDKPPRAAVLRALELLLALGAVDSNTGDLTKTIGQPLSRLPVDPMYGCILLASTKLGCAADILAIVSMISADMTVMYTPKDMREEAQVAHRHFISDKGDHLTLLAIYKAYTNIGRKERVRWCRTNFINNRALQKASDIYKQLQQHFERMNIPLASSSDPSVILKSLVAGLFPHAAVKLPDGTYRMIASGQIFWIHPSSVLHHKNSPYVVFNELVRTSRQYAKCVSVIEPAWLHEMAPTFFTTLNAR